MACFLFFRRYYYSVCIRDAKWAFSVKPRFPEHFQYLVLDVEDSEEQNLIRLFPGYRTLSSQFPSPCQDFYRELMIESQSETVHL